jgi:hypothetical protein
MLVRFSAGFGQLAAAIYSAEEFSNETAEFVVMIHGPLLVGSFLSRSH